MNKFKVGDRVRGHKDLIGRQGGWAVDCIRSFESREIGVIYSIENGRNWVKFKDNHYHYSDGQIELATRKPTIIIEDEDAQKIQTYPRVFRFMERNTHDEKARSRSGIRRRVQF